MNESAKKNVAAAFAANKDQKVYYANEAGHCFTEKLEGLEECNRKDYQKDIDALEAEAKKAEDKAAGVSEEATKKK